MEDQSPHQPQMHGILDCSLCLLTAGVGLVSFLLLLYDFLEKRRLRNAKHPPGPSGFPLWGHLPVPSNELLDRKCKECVKIYGPVFSLKFGTANVVMLSDIASIKQLYCADNEQSRPLKSIFREVSRGANGMFTLNGEVWNENRNFTVRVLRNLGYGKTAMEEHIKEELSSLVKQIEGAKGRAVPVFELVLSSVLNVTSGILFGIRYPPGDLKREYLTKHAAGYVEGIHCGPIIEWKPCWLSRLEASLPFTRTGAMRRHRKALADFIRDQVKEHEDTMETDVTRDFIDGYLKQVEKHQHDPNSAFRVSHLLGNSLELISGSATNTPALIHWLLVVCAHNPDRVQARIQKEVDDVVGRQRQPTWEDRKAMPFTMASVLEITRWKATTPFPMPRGVQEDTTIGKYVIPKGTMVLINLMGVHKNPDLWENPDRFDPTRFLTADGSELEKKPEHLIPFSLGKRKCPAEKLGYVEMFLYLSTLLQRFSVFPDKGTVLPDLECPTTPCGNTSLKKLCFVTRP